MMIKKFLFVLVCIICTSAFSQEIERISINGIITAPPGNDLEGITVFNISSQKGTITSASGGFEIEVAKNDRLQIAALQFQSFKVIIDEGILEKRTISIYLNPSTNLLDEVVVRRYDLSGNIAADVEKIKTYSAPKLDLSYDNLQNGYVFEPDVQTAISGNAAEAALNNFALKNGVNFIAILGGIVNLIVPKTTLVSYNAKEKRALATNLRQRFSTEFISETFNIPEDKTYDFIYFVEENGVATNLLKPENEMLLMELLGRQAELYKMKITEQ